MLCPYLTEKKKLSQLFLRPQRKGHTKLQYLLSFNVTIATLATIVWLTHSTGLCYVMLHALPVPHREKKLSQLFLRSQRKGHTKLQYLLSFNVTIATLAMAVWLTHSTGLCYVMLHALPVPHREKTLSQLFLRSQRKGHTKLQYLLSFNVTIATLATAVWLTHSTGHS